MDTTSTTPEILTASEAAALVRIYEDLRATERRVGQLGYMDDATPAQIRASARTAEAVEAVRDAIANLATVAHVYGECPVMTAAWDAR